MRIRIDLAYDGTAFHGWATQPGLRTVQGELQEALGTALRVKRTGERAQVWVTVAGRTDSGVHARGQVAHFDIDAEILESSRGRSEQTPLEALVRRLNGILPADLRVRRATEAPEGFNARFSALSRRYVYRIVDDPAFVDPLQRLAVLYRTRPLDLSAMNVASADLVGLNDFASFCKPREGATTIRNLRQLTWDRRDDGIIEATVVADAFCHSMVRSLVGCLMVIGEGRKDVAWAKVSLAARTRTSSIPIAPANGLTLEEVAYPPDDMLAAQHERTMNRRTESDLEANDRDRD
ncbi:tRNA pseudouridine(38-40) synthase TruA [Nocardioides albertanoniae]|uniref:tRNA pseudouridine(38-40) synthase TruA n=1 Tax=Nocardioides albertanoniae TaxID=1175486 RepID=UPI001153DD9E|nr:tRNA pseudouridine(38-40) synthase TruA [Nocardioides albertanoniae]